MMHRYRVRKPTPRSFPDTAMRTLVVKVCSRTLFLGAISTFAPAIKKLIISLLQLINLLTTKELKLALPKKPLKPRTFILRPGQCLMLGGLARLDYFDVRPLRFSPYICVYLNNL